MYRLILLLLFPALMSAQGSFSVVGSVGYEVGTSDLYTHDFGGVRGMFYFDGSVPWSVGVSQHRLSCVHFGVWEGFDEWGFLGLTFDHYLSGRIFDTWGFSGSFGVLPLRGELIDVTIVSNFGVSNHFLRADLSVGFSLKF